MLPLLLREKVVCSPAQVKAISHHGDEELCAVSQDMMRQHLSADRNCRILMQVYIG